MLTRRLKDVGKPKAEVAAAAIVQRVSGVQVTPHFCRIEEKPLEFYEQFHVIILGLDSLEARRYMNQVACSFLGELMSQREVHHTSYYFMHLLMLLRKMLLCGKIVQRCDLSGTDAAALKLVHTCMLYHQLMLWYQGPYHPWAFAIQHVIAEQLPAVSPFEVII